MIKKIIIVIPTVDNFLEILSKFFVFANNEPEQSKIVFGIGNNTHYTIHFGKNSEYINIHRTDEKSSQNKKLFVMKKSDAIVILNDVEHIFSFLFAKYLLSNKIDIDTILRKKWSIIPVHDNPKSMETIVKIKNKRLKFAKEVHIQKLKNLYKPAKDLMKHDSNVFMLVDKKYELMGTIVKDSTDPRLKTFYIISEKKILHYNGTYYIY